MPALPTRLIGVCVCVRLVNEINWEIMCERNGGMGKWGKIKEMGSTWGERVCLIRKLGYNMDHILRHVLGRDLSRSNINHGSF